MHGELLQGQVNGDGDDEEARCEKQDELVRDAHGQKIRRRSNGHGHGKEEEGNCAHHGGHPSSGGGEPSSAGKI
ncbi:hypothetical protein D3C84_1267050 [compost metagenome]